MVKKRERLEIIKDILNSVRDSKEIKPTRLLYSSNLSPQMFKDYVEELVRKNMIKFQESGKGKKTILLTGKGNEFLEQYKVIENFVESFGL